MFPFCLHLHWIFSNFLTLRNIRFNTFFASTKVQCACPGGIALVINAPSALNYFALHWILMQKKTLQWSSRSFYCNTSNYTLNKTVKSTVLVCITMVCIHALHSGMNKYVLHYTTIVCRSMQCYASRHCKIVCTGMHCSALQ